ncbi:hypothetical protein F5146DRAFT_1145181 [Armillaria mellea]|nr:hypothetical protein F5146DRAFT_1145181 [Armillaria mellea]
MPMEEEMGLECIVTSSRFLSNLQHCLTYLDPIVGFTRGIAPTMLLGCVAVGHAQPDNSWKGSVMISSLHFGQDSIGSSVQNSVVPGLSRFEDDFEAQLANPREVKHSCMGLQEDTEQGSSEATENRLG